MGDLEDLRGLGRVRLRIDRARRRRALDVDASAPEDEQVEIELPRAPAFSRSPPELAFELLERGEERDRAALRVRRGADVERDHGIAELGLVRDPDRLRRIEA
jgi:hypothetical protein